MTIRHTVERHPLVSFVLLAYALSWTCWLTASALYPASLPAAERAPAQLLGLLGTFGPFVAAVLVARLSGEWSAFRARLLAVRVAPRWYALALLVPVIGVAVSYGLYRLLGGAPGDVAGSLSVPMLLGAFVFTLVVGGGNEEPGWRGLALPHLQARFGPLIGSLVLAAVWAGWHLPAFFDPASSQSVLPPLAWLLSTVAITLALTWLFNRTGESVPLAALFHASFNVAGLAVIAALPVDSVAAFYWVGAGTFLVGAAVLVLVTHRRLGAAPAGRSVDPHGHPVTDGGRRE